MGVSRRTAIETTAETGPETGANRPPDAPGIVKSTDTIEMRPVAAGARTRFQVLVGPDDGASNFVLRRFVMGAGGGMPTHSNQVEHEQYVLRGRARVTIGEAVYEVAHDDALYIPAGAPHSYEVLEAPFEFLCVVPNAPDQIRLRQQEAQT